MILARLDLAFKGDRNYIHGTDMLNAVSDLLSQRIGATTIRHLRFVFSRMTRRNLQLRLEMADPSRPVNQVEASVAHLTFDAQGDSWRGDLIEDAGEPMARHPFDEQAIIECCERDAAGHTISLDRVPPGATPIDVIVTMTKALHQALLPDAPGQWVFCRWDCDQWPFAGSTRALSVMLAQSLGLRLTRSSVFSGADRVGDIYFGTKVYQ